MPKSHSTACRAENRLWAPWIRKLWEVSTGLATGTVFQGENNNDESNYDGAWFHPCGTNAGRDHHDCTKIHSPRVNETRFVKSHFPKWSTT